MASNKNKRFNPMMDMVKKGICPTCGEKALQRLGYMRVCKMCGTFWKWYL
jgi:uncharacterized protein (DUF983 family)